MSDAGASPNRREILKGALLGSGILGAVGATAYQFRKSDETELADPFAYDIEAYKQVDPALHLCHEQRPSIELGLQQPRRFCLRQGRFYVAGDNAVVVLDKSGIQSDVFALGQPPYCLDVDQQGALFVGFTGEVHQYDGGGNLLKRWEIPSEAARLTAVVADADRVFAADAGTRLIHVFDRSTDAYYSIGGKDADGGYDGFAIPSPYFDMVLGGDGLLRVANTGKHRIETYTRRGELQSFWGKTGYGVEGFCGCCNPISFTLLPDGRYVTCEKGLTRVKIYSRDGTFNGLVAGPDQFAEHDAICSEYGTGCTHGGMDVAADVDGVYVLDPYTRRIRVFRFNEST